jgi:NAD+ diphosphatase
MRYYPEAVNLPFNSEVIRGFFRPVRPGEPHPDGECYWIMLQGGALVVEERDGRYVLPEGDFPSWLIDAAKPICIGIWKDKPLMAICLSRSIHVPKHFHVEPFNASMQRLDDQILTLGGLAHQILSWRRNSTHCSQCGSGMTTIKSTWGKRCNACGHEHFPHIHPCIIVLVRRGDQFLLARKGAWPIGRYSLVAGFVDFGESLEECVHREVMEETGISITNLRYVGSQNWPFPSQLMAGFVADYAGGEISIDHEELEDAGWFCTGDMPPDLPGKRSIARWIIDTYALANTPKGEK